ncbi:Bug family tripartite tricarboxylate transporter substrate binding protein [Pelagibacterium lacus]|uniref:Tripartite tricarboxylate transporter substrate binding protein n=1 Tax=Pelagibacterium lacus TaxID=2282655 RepID=A0A369VZZ2_9HYPH|nr:tripartite tricarboxylate transporter substrate binding protein [Pelagibacterium lacus]RDE07878.1 tripartite tricarboxylate transporter substrate binding protein [Pelagibacterium lacus]
MRFNLTTRMAAILFASCAMAGAASAQDDFPSRAVTIVVPYATGGMSSTLTQLIAEKMQENLGQPVIVSNQPGANGNLASGAVARAAPDGYTILLGTPSTLTLNPHLYAETPFDLFEDFDPLGLYAITYSVVLTHPDTGYETIDDIVAAAQAAPGTINFGSSGPGSFGHLAGELLAALGDVEMTHIPYPGGGPALTDLMAGRLSFIFGDTIALEQVEAGNLDAVALAGIERIAQAPDLETVAEQGWERLDFTGWQGYVVPRGTPEEIVVRLNEALAYALEDETLGQRINELGADVADPSPEVFAEVLRSNYDKWDQVVQDVDVVIE